MTEPKRADKKDKEETPGKLEKIMEPITVLAGNNVGEFTKTVYEMHHTQLRRNKLFIWVLHGL